MNATIKKPTEDKLQSLCRLLRSWGYDVADFVFEEERSGGLAGLLGVKGGALRVSRRSTGEARFYPVGIDSPWFAALLKDLARGHFADAPETAPAPLVDIVRRTH